MTTRFQILHSRQPRLTTAAILVFLFFGAFFPISFTFAAEGTASVVQATPPYDETITDEQALDIAETTFRYQFKLNDPQARQRWGAYYLVLFDKDPSPAFLLRFKEDKFKVLPGSQFEELRGIKFNVSSIQRISDTQVKVWGSRYTESLSAEGGEYFLEFKDGIWVVIEYRMHWIS